MKSLTKLAPVLGFVGLILVQAARGPDARKSDQVFRTVKNEMLVQLASLAGFDSTLPMPEVFVEPASASSEELTLWHASTSLRHWNRFTVAALEGRNYRLGGFVAPEVLEFAHALRSHRRIDVAQESELLAKLTDENAGTELFFPERTSELAPGQRRALAEWREVRPATWRSDGVTRLPGGMVGVQLTALSHGARGWSPTLFFFLYAEPDSLVSWSRIRGEMF